LANPSLFLLDPFSSKTVLPFFFQLPVMFVIFFSFFVLQEMGLEQAEAVASQKEAAPSSRAGDYASSPSGIFFH